MGCTIDATHGRLTVITAGRQGGTQSADFAQGAFVLTQNAKGVANERLAGGNFAACKKRAGHSLARAARKGGRRLWGSGRGSYNTGGRYGAATVRGTTWLVADSCKGTLVRAIKGKVDVRDLVRKRTIHLRAPHSYLARPRGR